jgi:hypothetical protein
VFAICEASPNALVAAGAAAVLIAIVASVLLLLRAARGYRIKAAAVFAAALVAGAVIATTPGGLTSGANYLGRFFAGVAVGVGASLFVALAIRRNVLIIGALGLLGGGGFLASIVLLLIATLAATGGCID